MPATALSAAQAARATEAHRLAASQPATAVALARSLLREAPSAPDAHQLLGLCLAQAGDATGAEQAFRQALQLAPGHPAALANLAQLLRKLGRREEAQALLNELLARAPQQASVWTDHGLNALALGQVATAVESLRRAVQLAAGSARAWHGLGNALRAQGELREAEAAYRKALSLTPAAAGLWAALGGTLRLQGRAGEALECYAMARRHGMSGPELDDAEVGALLDDARLDEAFARARRMTEQHPDYIPGLVTRANLAWEYDDWRARGDDPLAHFRSRADAEPGNDALQLAYLSFLLEAKRCEEAIERLQHLRRRGDNPLLTTLHANALELLDRSAEAAPLYARAHRGYGNANPSFLNAYVRHLLKAGDWQRAAELSQAAVAVDPDNQESWAYLATAWRLLEDPREHWLCDYDNLVALCEVEPPAGHADMASFLQALTATLDHLHQARTEPVRQSLRGGSQTSGRLFGRPEQSIQQVERALLATIERRIAQLPRDDSHPYLRRRARSVSFSGSWSVKLWSSGNHVNHFHSEGWMSSAFYVALPPSVRAGAEDHAGCIQFGQPPVELGLALPPRRIIQPQLGHLALFPSYLWHGTVPFVDEHPRMTIAFDMLPR